MSLNGSETTSIGATLTAGFTDQIDRAVKEEVSDRCRMMLSCLSKGIGVSMEKLLEVEGINEFLTTDKPVMCRPCVPPVLEKAVAKVQDAPTTPLVHEAFNPCKCRARVFGSGAKKAMGPQCTRKKVDGSEYCKKHTAELEEEKKTGHQLPFGNYDEPRSSTRLDKAEFGGPCCWEDEKKKSNRGRKKKVKEEPVAEEVGNKVINDIVDKVDGVDMGAGTGLEPLPQEVIERKPESVEKRDDTICIDGIDYMMEEGSSEVVDVEDFSIMGEWIDGKMVWAEGMEEKHKQSLS